jgi:hypothetical protein
LLGAREPARDFPQPFAGVERPARDLELGPQVVQMPAQSLLVLGATRDEIVAMVREQPDIERPSVQVRSRERLESFAQRRPATLNASIESDLPRSRAERRAPAMCLGATRTTRSPRATRNRSKAPDTCRQSSSAQTRSGSSLRAHNSSFPKLPVRAGAVSSPRAAAVSASTAPQVCVFLCVSVPTTIICTVPSIDDEADSGGHVSLEALARLLSVTPVGLGRRRATQQPSVTPVGRQKVNESARRRPENQPRRSDVTAQTQRL